MGNIKGTDEVQRGLKQYGKGVFGVTATRPCAW